MSAYLTFFSSGSDGKGRCTMDTDVLVVGAGPAGLTAANVMARYGVRVCVIDGSPGPMDESRASIVHVRTLELWDKLGLADRALAQGQRIAATRISQGPRVLADLPTAGPAAERTPFPFALGYEQWKSQALLLEGLREAGTPPTVLWNTRLVSLDQTQEHATAGVSPADGPVETITARWAIGADGARSSVRKLLDIPFDGETYGQVGFLADVDMDLRFSMPPNRLNMFIAPVGDAGIMRLHESGRSPYRLFGTITPGLRTAVEAARDEPLGVADLQRWFDEQFRVPAVVKRCDWYLAYRLHRRTASRFRAGRWFLVGDSAHVHPPSGGQGANLSMGDGYNLGWKLGAVLSGQADPRLLDSYETERHRVARTVVSAADKGIKVEAASPAARRVRQVVLPLMFRALGRIPAARANWAKLMTQTWIRYPWSPAVAGDRDARRARPGDRAPDALIHDGPRTRHLFELLRGVGHHLLLLEGVEPDPGFRAAADEAEEAARAYRIALGVHRLPTGQDDAHHAYDVTAPTAVLVRPDGHIAYRGPLADRAALRRYLHQWYTPGDAGPDAPAAPAGAKPWALSSRGVNGTDV